MRWPWRFWPFAKPAPVETIDRRERLRRKVMERVEISAGGCWLWTGPDSGSGRGGGYGRICIDGATMAVHIVMWVIRNGPVPPRKQIDHSCVNRRCCNPDHLELVTPKRNARLRDQRRAAA